VASTTTDGDPDHSEEGGEAFEGGSIENVGHIERDETLQHPRCVYQLLKRHYARYTPAAVADVCGITEEQFLTVARALVANSGRERTSAFVYSVGWTQHTVGVQYIRAASILQLLLGNIGRPGGGILALRGHASIQGSTDIPTLYDLLPGYLPMPTAGHHDDLDDYERRTPPRRRGTGPRAPTSSAC
jgi:formate dehydrogenase major subunit